MKKYQICYTPVLICPCLPNGMNAMSTCFQQRYDREYDTKEEMDEVLFLTWKTIICCVCHKEAPPTHLMVLQKTPTSKHDDLFTWHTAGMVPVTTI